LKAINDHRLRLNFMKILITCLMKCRAFVILPTIWINFAFKQTPKLLYIPPDKIFLSSRQLPNTLLN
jgi:hypothetical protein